MQRDRDGRAERAPASKEGLGRTSVLQRSLRRLSPREQGSLEENDTQAPQEKTV